MKNLIAILMDLSKDAREMKIGLQLLREDLTKPVSGRWTDSCGVMQALRIGKRGLQSLRDRGLLPFSLVNRKFYYRMSDLSALLESGYVKGKRKRKGSV